MPSRNTRRTLTTRRPTPAHRTINPIPTTRRSLTPERSPTIRFRPDRRPGVSIPIRTEPWRHPMPAAVRDQGRSRYPASILGPHLHIRAGRVLDWLELAVTRVAGRYLATGVFRYPLLPRRPPRIRHL